MHIAAESGNVGCINSLLAHGATVDAKDAVGATPLLLALREQRPKAIARLLAAGANIKAIDNQHANALHYAATGGSLALVKQVMAAGLSPTDADINGETPLVPAARTLHQNIVRYLLKQYKPTKTQLNKALLAATTQSSPATDKACRNLVLLLHAQGADMMPHDEKGNTP